MESTWEAQMDCFGLEAMRLKKNHNPRTSSPAKSSVENRNKWSRISRSSKRGSITVKPKTKRCKFETNPQTIFLPIEPYPFPSSPCFHSSSLPNVLRLCINVRSLWGRLRCFHSK